MKKYLLKLGVSTLLIISVTDNFAQTACQKIGESCEGGVYAGQFEGVDLITTPSNCNDSKTPECDGTTDTLQFKWAAQTGISTMAKDVNDGRVNVDLILRSKHTDLQAVSYCQQLDFGGHQDWYLPAQNELLHLYKNKDLIGGFNTSGLLYWSSTEINMGMVKMIKFRDGAQLNGGKPSLYLVRCVRRKLP